MLTRRSSESAWLRSLVVVSSAVAISSTLLGVACSYKRGILGFGEDLVQEPVRPLH